MAVQAEREQRSIWFVADDGRVIEVGVGGYERPVNVIRRDAGRYYVAAVLGWVDTRAGDAETLARQLVNA